ncbi:hypothetical protein Vretimale_11154 [Volvox reticuliferus]|uniref:Uncharacterized protein n=1 Tax=Volvox reticuliferus TaxID=1737510 RepID=A0A8J4D0N3_9CHLO|nr:hypothetical protein Vretifemale_17097 [Volvox reticuliferus]GIM06909.1 hypothetical protein Vretimale_11154 [Volvox reticuliferus]
MATTGNSKYNFESERLTLPKAAISYDKTGRPIYGLLDVPARRQCGHQFEEAKAVANVEAQDKMLRPQSGQRSAARELMQMEWARREDEAQRKSPRQVVDFYLRTSVDNPLSGIPAANNPLRTSVRTYSDEELPVSLRTHVMPYMAPTAADLAREKLSSRETASRNQAILDKITAVREFGKRTCEQYPHGLTRLELAKLRANNNRVLNMADLPALSIDYTSTPSLHY